MTTLEAAEFAIIRAKIELELIDDPEYVHTVTNRKFVRESVLETIRSVLNRINDERQEAIR